MTSLVLPPPKHQVFREEAVAPAPTSTQLTVARSKAPPYGQRKGFVPRTTADFGDGGAFPEIHVAQYPLDMGRKDGRGGSQQTVPLTLDSQGRIKYDAIVNPGGDRQVQARLEDMMPKKFTDDEMRRPDPEEEAEVAERTRQALNAAVGVKVGGSITRSDEPTYIRYTPSQKGTQFNSGASTRIIRLTEAPVDPLEPPKFKAKKMPRGPPSPPVPVMHSPPRKVTVKDQNDWKIPPCISNWKNNRGYIIPLDKRLAADGRGLQEQTINDNFAKLSESLYIAERNAREEVQKRAEIEKMLKLKEKEKKEEMLRRLAQEARAERVTAATGAAAEPDEEDDARRERDNIRDERRRERERDLRMQRNKSQAARNLDRDVSERIALGMAVPQKTGETLFDQRLFNQTQGMQSGFGEDDDYSVYSKPLFSGSSANQIYRPKKGEDSEAYGTKEDLDKLHDTSRFRPDKEFTGVDREKGAEPRAGPVEFEREEDPFGLDEFLSAAKTGAKPLDKIGTSGHMHAGSTGGAGGANSESGSKRGRIEFDSSSRDRDSRRDDRDRDRDRDHRDRDRDDKRRKH
jgi:SNW domain-containing protein 1